MAKRTEKQKYTIEDVVEACTSRESDVSDLEQSEAVTSLMRDQGLLQ